MALELITIPGEISFSNSPNEFVLKSNTFIEDAGARFRANIFIGTQPVDGEEIRFAFLGQTVLLEFDSTPNNSGFELAITDYGQLADFYEQLAKDFAANFVLNETFLITAEDDRIVFASRKFETIELNPFGTTADMGVSTQSFGTPRILRDNYFVNVSIYAKIPLVPAGLDFDIIDELSIRPDEKGNMAIDVSSFIESYVFTTLPKLSPAEPYLLDELEQLQVEYFVEFLEFFGNVPSPGSAIIRTDTLTVIKGGLSHEDFPTYKDLLPAMIKKADGTARFLNYGPKEVEISDQQPEYLLFINPFEQAGGGGQGQ